MEVSPEMLCVLESRPSSLMAGALDVRPSASNN